MKKKNKAIKRLAAALLSLSMVIAPMHTAGLSMTVYAASEDSSGAVSDPAVLSDDTSSEAPAEQADVADKADKQAETEASAEKTTEAESLPSEAEPSTEGKDKTETLPSEAEPSPEGTTTPAEDAATENQPSEGAFQTEDTGASKDTGAADTVTADETTTAGETTSADQMAAADETTAADQTTAADETTAADQTTAAGETTAAADTTTEAGTTAAETLADGTPATEVIIVPNETTAAGTGTEETTAASTSAEGTTAAETTAAGGTTASADGTVKGGAAQNGLQSEKKTVKTANPFGLSDGDMPKEADPSENTSNSKITVKTANTSYGDSFTITYTTQDDEQKDFKVDSSMDPSLNVIYKYYGEPDDKGKLLQGFEVLTVAVTVEDENGSSLTFYADDIADDKDFYITVTMELNNGDRFNSGVSYYGVDTEGWAEDDFEEAWLNGGRYTIDIKKPYGTYAAYSEVNKKASETGKALIIAVNGDESLKTVPVDDANAVKMALVRTEQFKEEDVTILVVPADTSKDAVKDSYKQQVWNWIETVAAADSNEFTFIGYSGHGGYYADGTSELSIGGDNTISAVELKEHLGQLHGKVVLMFDCCYSGGMIMPTSIELADAGTDDYLLDGAGYSDDYLLDDFGYAGDDTAGYSESDYEEDYAEYIKEICAQAQQGADEFVESFVDQFNDAEVSDASDDDSTSDQAADAGAASRSGSTAKASEKSGDSESTGTGSSTGADSIASVSDKALEYYIYTAASAYETSIQDDYAGGQLMVAFGQALGYDRKDAGYDIYAADVDDDGEINAEELSEYIKARNAVAVPTVYYSEANAKNMLFSYDKADSSGGHAGISAVLSMETLEEKNVVNNNGEVQVHVMIRNYSDHDVSFDAAAILGGNAGENFPGAVDKNAYSKDMQDQLFFATNIVDASTGVASKTLAKKSSAEYIFTFKDPSGKYFSAGGRFQIKIWGTDNDSSKAFDLTDFYIGAGETAAAVDDAGKAAFAIKKPAQIYSATGTIEEVSAYVPVNVTFDTEPTSKSGYAALTLTARYYDLGDSNGWDGKSGHYGYETFSDGSIGQNGTEIDISDTSKYPSEEIFAVRPAYVRNDVYKMNTAGSTYSYVWDVSTLTQGHYYALQVECKYDDGSSQKKTTFIKVVDKVTAYGSDTIIGESFIGLDTIVQNTYGIKVGETWMKYDNHTVAGITGLYTDYLNELSYKTSSGKTNIQYYIADEDSTGWYVLENGSLTPMKESDTFESGKSYVNRIYMCINDGYNAKFAYGATFKVGGHTLYNEGEYKTTVSDDQKTATIYVLHKNITIKQSDLKVCLAGSKEPLKDTDVLKRGDCIDVYAPDGCTIDSGALVALKSVKGPSDCWRYEVIEAYDGDKNLETEVQVVMYKPSSGDLSEDCCCASVIFAHDISDTPAPDGGSSDSDSDDSSDDSDDSSDYSNGTSQGTWQTADAAGAQSGAAAGPAGAAGAGSATLYRFKLADGRYATGWQYINYKGVTSWYLFDGNGYMRTGWAKDGSSWYYLEEDGAMKTGGWVKYQNDWYHLDSNGRMTANGWTKYQDSWYYLGSDGKMTKGWVKDGGIWYYLDGEGKMRIGWIKDQNNWYYLDKQGKMVTGDQTIDGKEQHFGQDGALTTGSVD